jgi:hypothetical protein
VREAGCFPHFYLLMYQRFRDTQHLHGFFHGNIPFGGTELLKDSGVTAWDGTSSRAGDNVDAIAEGLAM